MPNPLQKHNRGMLLHPWLPMGAVAIILALLTTYGHAQQVGPVQPVSTAAASLSAAQLHTNLTNNLPIANSIGVNAVGTFLGSMGSGAQTSCDSTGRNCRSPYDTSPSAATNPNSAQIVTLNYTAMQKNAQQLTGLQGSGANNASVGNGLDTALGGILSSTGSSTSVGAQTGSTVLSCGTPGHHYATPDKILTLVGIALKVHDCSIAANGNATLTYQTCTAPLRGIPVHYPPNTVVCSKTPGSANFYAPAGKTCDVGACDGFAVNDQNGWSSPQTVYWDSTQAPGASTQATAGPVQSQNNGLGFTFFPALGNGVPASFTAGSDTVIALQIVKSYISPPPAVGGAVGLNMAYRHTLGLTADQLTNHTAATNLATTTNPQGAQYTLPAWDTVTKLQANPDILKYQKDDAQNGAACLNQIKSGLSSTGAISICGNSLGAVPKTSLAQGESPPIATTTMVAVAGNTCSTTPTCTASLPTTTTWTTQCNVDVPLAVSNSNTTTTWTYAIGTWYREAPTYTCDISRAVTDTPCVTSAYVTGHQCAATGPTCVRAQKCQLGTQSQLYQSGYSPCYPNGGDQLQVTWGCTADDAPPVSVAMSKGSGWITSSAPYLLSGAAAGGCYAQLSNNTTCKDGQCSGTAVISFGTKSMYQTNTQCQGGQQPNPGYPACTLPPPPPFDSTGWTPPSSCVATVSCTPSYSLGSFYANGGGYSLGYSFSMAYLLETSTTGSDTCDTAIANQ